MAATEPFAALADAQDFIFDRPDALPDVFRNKLRELVRPGNLPLPLAMRDLAELVYAWRDELPAEMKAIGEQAVRSLIAYQQFGYQTDRGPAMVAVLTGELPEGETAPEVERELTADGIAAAERAKEPLPEPSPASYAPAPR